VFYEVHPCFRDKYNKAAEFDEYRPKKPLKDKYELYTAAAKAADIITEILPYATKSLIIKEAVPIKARELNPDVLWYDLIFDNDTSFNSLPHNQRFFHILRADIEDPLFVLMVVMLPNVSQIFLRIAPADITALAWPTSKHHFTKLRRLIAYATDGILTWPVGFFNSMLAEGKVETLEACLCSSWYRDLDDVKPVHTKSVPVTPKPNFMQLKKLELLSSCLKSTDLICSVKTCPSLTTIVYLNGDAETGP
jgi:hypothetical protein